MTVQTFKPGDKEIVEAAFQLFDHELENSRPMVDAFILAVLQAMNAARAPIPTP